MKWKKVIRKDIDERGDGVSVAGGVNAVIAANINEPGSEHTSVSSKHRVVQRGGKTIVKEHEVTTSGERDEPERGGTDD